MLEKQPTLGKNLTAVITNTLFRECKNESCKNFFKGVASRNNTMMRLGFLPGKTEIAIKQNQHLQTKGQFLGKSCLTLFSNFKELDYQAEFKCSAY